MANIFLVKILLVKCMIQTFNFLSMHVKRWASTYKQIHPRPLNVNPPTFRQTVVHSDGSVFSIRTTSPKSIVMLTKDTLNHALWNPLSVKLDDTSGQISKFSSRFGDFSEFDSVVSDQVIPEKKTAPPPPPPTPAKKKKK